MIWIREINSIEEQLDWLKEANPEKVNYYENIDFLIKKEKLKYYKETLIRIDNKNSKYDFDLSPKHWFAYTIYALLRWNIINTQSQLTSHQIWESIHAVGNISNWVIFLSNKDKSIELILQSSFTSALTQSIVISTFEDCAVNQSGVVSLYEIVWFQFAKYGAVINIL